MEIRKVGVIGAGQMGHGIAIVAASSGYEVVMQDIEDRFIQTGLAKINKFLGKSVEKGKMTEADKAATLARVKGTTDLRDLRDCDLVIEAAVEDFDIKCKVFRELDKICPVDSILATNTSSISITRLANATTRPGKFVGMHFFNPVPMMKLVEVIKGLRTEQATADAVVAMARRLGKEPIEVNDYPGFISNRVLMPMINEACYCLYEGLATREAIDGVMKLGMNHPMGPLELADLIGLDTCLSIMRVLRDGYSDSKYRPCPLLVKMVDAGMLGKKVGRGFYEYGK